MGSPKATLSHISNKTIIIISQLGDSSIKSKQVLTLCKRLGISSTTLIEGEKKNLFHISSKGQSGTNRYGPFELTLTDKGKKHFHWSNPELGIQNRVVSYLAEQREVASEDAIRDIGAAIGLTRAQARGAIGILLKKRIVTSEVRTSHRGVYTIRVAINENLLKDQAKPRPKKMVLPAPSEASPKPVQQTGKGFMGVIEHLIEKEVQLRLEAELKQREESDRDFIKDLLDDFAKNGDVAPLKLLSDIHEYVSN